jgi:hypothetical protein
MRMWLVLALVLGCGGAGTETQPTSSTPRILDHVLVDNAADKLVAAAGAGDAAAIAAMLDEPFDLGGMWFEDPSCRAQFLAPARLRGNKLGAFATSIS